MSKWVLLNCLVGGNMDFLGASPRFIILRASFQVLLLSVAVSFILLYELCYVHVSDVVV